MQSFHIDNSPSIPHSNYEARSFISLYSIFNTLDLNNLTWVQVTSDMTKKIPNLLTLNFHISLQLISAKRNWQKRVFFLFCRTIFSTIQWTDNQNQDTGEVHSGQRGQLLLMETVVSVCSMRHTAKRIFIIM